MNIYREYTQSRSFSPCNITKTADFSTRYTTIPNTKIKVRLKELVQLCLKKKEWPMWIRMPCFRKGQILFRKKNTGDSNEKFSETDIIKNERVFDWQDISYIGLMDIFFNIHSAFLLVPTALLFSRLVALLV